MNIMVTISIYTLCTILSIIMLNIKILCTVVLMLCIVPVVYGEYENETWFDATCKEQFEDAEGGLKLLLLGIVGIFVLVCAISTLGGWGFHNQKLFNKGLSGFGVLIALAIVYAIAVGVFDYYINKYW